MGEKIKKYIPFLFSILLVVLGLYIYSLYLETHAAFTVILFIISTLAMLLIVKIWRNFTNKHGPAIIYFTANHKILRKFVAGGSFSYYEYKRDPDKVGMFEPIGRFISLMIGFIGIATALANAIRLNPASPVESIWTVLVWGFLILVVPIILTPIIPVTWAMEDLNLRAWNKKFGTNVRVSQRYKTRFNSLISIGSLSIAFSMSNDPNLQFLDNITNFLLLLYNGILILTYPIALLTLLYYLIFRGSITSKVREKMPIPIAETRLIYRNSKGQIIDEEGNVVHDINTLFDVPEIDEEEPSPVEEEEDTQPTVKDKIFGFGKKLKENTIGKVMKKEDTTKSGNDDKPKRGSATRDLWDDEGNPKEVNIEDDNDQEYKYKGGSATEGLWDKEENKD